MSVERDTDQVLRAWISEGSDRAPERFVWAALDEVERLPQRPAWRTSLAGLLGQPIETRLGPVAGFVSAAAVIAVAIAIALFRSPSVGPAQRFDAGDLAAIVVWEDTKPATWRLDNLVSNPTDVSRIPIRSMTEAEINAFPEPAGLLAGRYTNFSGQTDGAFMSWALLFDDERDAAAALPFYQRELSSPDAWGFGSPEPVALGAGGYRYEGETTAFLGPPTGVDPHPGDVYLWRDGNLLLAVGGWFTFDATEVRAAADGMDQRAASSLQR